MQLLFDENLSPSLVTLLAAHFPGSVHVHGAGLGSATDEEVWTYARDHGLVVVSKDSDFLELSVLRGAPPKLVWLRVGNCTTAQLADVLRAERAKVTALMIDETSRYCVIE